MIRYVLIISIFIFGFLLYEPQQVIDSTTNSNYNFDVAELNNFNTGILFIDIFINNLIICFFIAFFGYISGGLVSLIVIFWNGFLLSMFVKTGYLLISMSDFIYFSKHIPLELFSIFLFANFGLNGFEFYKRLIIKKEIHLIHKREITRLLLPLALLLISSIIETL